MQQTLDREQLVTQQLQSKLLEQDQEIESLKKKQKVLIEEYKEEMGKLLQINSTQNDKVTGTCDDLLV